MSEGVAIHHVTKRYDTTVAVADVSLAVPPGTLLALLGPSGCGKSTTLRLIAGLERPDAGDVWLGPTCVASPDTWVPPEARRVGLVFQDYALFPHLTVAKNVAFPLNRWSHAEQRARIATMLELVGLGDLGARYPHQLSGGQQQRVALARALAADPTVVLLDEPFSNLDATLRKQVRAEVHQILEQAGATTLFVTHDQEEAFSMADVVAVMIQGRIVQMDTPLSIYTRPVTPAVAAFVGEANFLTGQANGATVTCWLGQVPLVVPCTGAVTILIRPENLVLTPNPDGAGRVERVRFLGYDQLVDLCLADGHTLQARMRPQADMVPGTQVHLHVAGAVMAYPEEAMPSASEAMPVRTHAH